MLAFTVEQLTNEDGCKWYTITPHGNTTLAEARTYGEDMFRYLDIYDIDEGATDIDGMSCVLFTINIEAEEL